MKKIVCLFAVLLLCLSLAMPAYATGFVPSVSRPEKPNIGNVILGVIEKVEDALEEIVENVEEVDSCIIISTVREAKEKLTDISQEERDTLVEIYEQLFQGQMELPVPRSNVVLQVVDVSWEYHDCVRTEHTHEEEMEMEETVLVADFDLDVAPDTEVTVLVYVAGEWESVEKVTNNGDGTVTCQFHHIGPVVFCVPGEEPQEVTVPTMPAPAEPEVPEYPLIPLILLLTAFVLFLLLIFLRRRRKEEEQG